MVMKSVSFPQGFRSIVANVGVKESDWDFSMVWTDEPFASSGMYTQSHFAGPSVKISRVVTDNHCASGVIVISGCANVATGKQGFQNAEKVRTLIANKYGLNPDNLLIASTGVIGPQLPIEKISHSISQMDDSHFTDNAFDVALAMKTTDTRLKVAQKDCGHARIVGVAKGIGMMEPNMATLICSVFTDARIPEAELKSIFRGTIEVTFNALSIDTDTSTSDTATIISSGKVEDVETEAFRNALYEVCLSLVKQIASDGEGAGKLIEISVAGAQNTSEAKYVAKSIVNSPLVKTAVHGADPNWGRVIMAIGKCIDVPKIDPDDVTVQFGGIEVYPRSIDDATLTRLSKYLEGDSVSVDVSIGDGPGEFTVYGCDLSSEYVRINSEYTT